MIDRKFWEKAQKAWVQEAPAKIDTVIGDGGEIDASLLTNPLSERDVESFDDLDFMGSFESVTRGDGTLVKKEPKLPLESENPKRPKLDRDAFDELIEKGDIPGFIGAFGLLRKCELPKDMDDLYQELVSGLGVLQEAIIKFESVYHADMDQFYEYYIPETLNLTATYLEYLDIGIDEETVSESKDEVMQAAGKLLTAISDKKEEILKFAQIEIKAQAKALEAMMSSDGYVDPVYKISNES